MYTPGRPRNVTVDRQGATATIRWDPPADDGGNYITEYFVFNQTAKRIMAVSVTDTVTRVTNLPLGDVVFSVHVTGDGTNPFLTPGIYEGPPQPTGERQPPPPRPARGRSPGRDTGC